MALGSKPGVSLGGTAIGALRGKARGGFSGYFQVCTIGVKQGVALNVKP